MQEIDNNESAVNFINERAKKDFANELDDKTAMRFVMNLEMAAWGIELTIPHEKLKQSVGAKAVELKRNGRPAKRCVYVVERPGKVVVLHTFKKTSQGVDKSNMATARIRYKKWLETQQ